jgi:hypothetical protein
MFTSAAKPATVLRVCSFFRTIVKTRLAITPSIPASKILRATKRPELQKATARAELVNFGAVP